MRKVLDNPSIDFYAIDRSSIYLRKIELHHYVLSMKKCYFPRFLSTSER